MTFKQLFEAAVANVANQQFEGRTSAIDAIIYQGKLDEKFKEEVAKSKWQSGYCHNPYGRDDAFLQVCAHGCYRALTFKVRLKKTSIKRSYYGNVTCYTPVVAFLTNEDMMDMEIVDVLDKMYDEAEDVKAKVAEEERATKQKAEYKEITDKLTAVINEFNELPLEVRQLLRTEIPSIAFYY